MNIEQILKNAGCSVTKERKDIFSFIETKHIFSYNDILENFKNIGRASVFRTINLFLKL
jgi:Fe2+ or Zn2+ uptake regulation protein